MTNKDIVKLSRTTAGDNVILLAKYKRLRKMWPDVTVNAPKRDRARERLEETQRKANPFKRR